MINVTGVIMLKGFSFEHVTQFLFQRILSADSFKREVYCLRNHKKIS